MNPKDPPLLPQLSSSPPIQLPVDPPRPEPVQETQASWHETHSSDGYCREMGRIIDWLRQERSPRSTASDPAQDLPSEAQLLRRVRRQLRKVERNQESFRRRGEGMNPEDSQQEFQRLGRIHADLMELKSRRRHHSSDPVVFRLIDHYQALVNRRIDRTCLSSPSGEAANRCAAEVEGSLQKPVPVVPL